MKILALEFSSPQRSVAVLNTDARGGMLAASEVVEAAPGNTMQPLGLIESALKDAGLEREQIECLAVGLGPGSYNGIRVAIALAQGWQLASRVKLLGVSSTECVAAQAQADGLAGRLAVVIDAQRGEFYLAGYELNADGRQETSPLRLTSRDDVQARERAGELLIGPEVMRWFPNGRVVFPRAAMLGQMARGRKDFVAGEKLEPLYLRETQFVKAPRPRVVST
jgi:tRNA threonylcarbamoyl adenosine modification protein YeaZ